MSQRILGLDPGTNSLGWAVVDRKDDGTYELIKKGVLRFDAGAADSGETAAAQRRLYRAMRRRYFRRRLRKIELLKVLVKYRLCPHIDKIKLEQWKMKKTYPLLEDFMSWQKSGCEKGQDNPYYARFRCLTEKLDLSCQEDRFVLGRALYHLVQRRGYVFTRDEEELARQIEEKKSHEISEKKDNGGIKSAEQENDDNNPEAQLKKVKGGIAKLSEAMADAGCEYLGEYLYKMYYQYGNTIRLRGQYTERRMYEKEFHRICEVQGLDTEMVKKLENAIYFQRPLKSQRHLLGKCTYEKQKTRCLDSHPDFEEYRMLSFINRIKYSKSGIDSVEKPLDKTERSIVIEEILKYKNPRTMEQIARLIAGKDNYCYRLDPDEIKGQKTFIFNYPMDTLLPSCPFTWHMQKIFGKGNWKEAAAEVYALADTKNVLQVVDDIWHVTIDTANKRDSVTVLKNFAENRLQLNEKQATEFSKIWIPKRVTSLSLKAIRNILPFLRQGETEDKAVFMAKVPYILKKANKSDKYIRTYTQELLQEIKNLPVNENKNVKTTIRSYMVDTLSGITNFPESMIKDCLYHPTDSNIYQKVSPVPGAITLLPSPETESFRNPTAMKALYQIRKVVNELLSQGIIDNTTHVHVEYPRALNGPVAKKGWDYYNKWCTDNKEKAENLIEEFYRCNGVENPIISDKLIDKVFLWMEQNQMDIYGKTPTVKQIVKEDYKARDVYYDAVITLQDVMSDRYDIDHIIPRTMRGDDSLMNKCLTSSYNNQTIKGNSLPCQMPDYEVVGVNNARVFYYERYKFYDRRTKGEAQNFEQKALKYKNSLIRDYYKGKWDRFNAKEEPDGFSKWQEPGNASIARYLVAYLKTVFYNPNDVNKTQVFTYKSPLIAMMRKLWGVPEKNRDNHCHHCVDAIVIACTGKKEKDTLSACLKNGSFKSGQKFKFPLPWNSFVQDMNNISENTIVYYNTQNRFTWRTKRKTGKCSQKFEDKIQRVSSDSVRASLFKDTFYGMIEVQHQLVPLVYFKKNPADIPNICNVQIKDAVKKWVETGEMDNSVLNEKQKIIIHKPALKAVKTVALSDFKGKEGIKYGLIENIIDPKVRDAVREWYKNGNSGTLWLNKEKGIAIKSARVLTKDNPVVVKACRDKSTKGYKQYMLSMSDENYCIALYKKCKTVSGELFKNYKVAQIFKKGFDKSNIEFAVGSYTSKNKVLLNVLYKNQHIIFYDGYSKEDVKCWSQEDFVDNLWYITEFNSKTIGCKFHQCGIKNSKIDDNGLLEGESKDKESVGENLFIKRKRRFTKGRSTYENILVEGIDFRISVLGEIILNF